VTEPNGITSLSNIHYCALSDDSTHNQNIHGQVTFHRPKAPGYVPQQRLGQHPANVTEDMTKDGQINQWSWSATVYLAFNPSETITPYREAKLHIWTGEVVLSWSGHHSPSSWSQAQRLLQRTSVGLAFLYLQSLKGRFDILPFQPKLWHFIILPSVLEMVHFSTAIAL
jgi:hypothetical protein